MSVVTFRWSRFILRLGGCLFLWWVLTGGRASSWIIGVPTIALALWVMEAAPQTHPWRISFAGLLRFIPYFLLQSLRGGIDVARRAYSPRLPLDPQIIDFPLNLPPGPAQVFFLNSVSLLPGTLSADLNGTTLKVHLLDHKIDPQLDQLETRVAALFKCSLRGGDD
ncbi:MAG: Na+/H+ antiporter subunit E [Desulfuromonadales bacterium]|nr:Na+/H+ antiporter subunit E [Desulfuromonadales bacterium]